IKHPHILHTIKSHCMLHYNSTLPSSLFFSLVPFFLSTAAYFYLWIPDSPPSIMSAGVKSAPELLLAAAVLGWNGGQSILGVVGGMIFSAVGDGCLTWPELFLYGLGAFAVAHLLYSISFLSSCYTSYSSSGSSCWIRLLYLIVLIIGVGFYIFLYSFLQKLPNSDMLVPAVGNFTALLWQSEPNTCRLFKVVENTQHGNIIVMVTYYLAQLLIAVGDMKAVKDKDDFSKWKRS
uniref:lysoplasmalogenase n=1 Tax=Amphiprion percula TaxID=161767 RepID=A0A3P8TD96_AMPPE